MVKWLRCFIHEQSFSDSNPLPLETMPNVSLGILTAPNLLLDRKYKLRFRYGRGRNIAPIVVAFECLESKASEFFASIKGVPISWALLEEAANVREVQADDLISAFTCAALGWWAGSHREYSYVHNGRGHYILPPKRFVHEAWRSEINRILRDPVFQGVSTNLSD